jgi:hypothetical protein
MIDIMYLHGRFEGLNVPIPHGKAQAFFPFSKGSRVKPDGLPAGAWQADRGA